MNPHTKNHNQLFNEALDLLDYTDGEKRMIARLKSNIELNPTPLNIINLRRTNEQNAITRQYINAIGDRYNEEFKAVNKNNKKGQYTFPEILPIVKKVEETFIKRARKYKLQPQNQATAAKLLKDNQKSK